MLQSIRIEFEDLKQLRLKLPNIKAMRPPLPSSIFDIGLPPAIGSPGIFGHNIFGSDEQEILRMWDALNGPCTIAFSFIHVLNNDTT